MRKPMTMVLSVFGLSVLSAFAGIINIKPQVETVLSVTPIKQISVIQPELKVVKLPIVKNHSSFLNAVGYRESTNNYKAVNQFGYLGKYQLRDQHMLMINQLLFFSSEFARHLALILEFDNFLLIILDYKSQHFPLEQTLLYLI